MHQGVEGGEEGDRGSARDRVRKGVNFCLLCVETICHVTYVASITKAVKLYKRDLYQNLHDPAFIKCQTFSLLRELILPDTLNISH